jgi:chemosensory pili system protein ChpA (sensor histidine kinase/response regulator)
MMNSQENPIERPEDRDLENVDRANKDRELGNDEFRDLWTNDNSANKSESEENPDSSSDNFDLELSELDFRNPPTQDMSELSDLLDENLNFKLDNIEEVEETAVVWEKSQELDAELELIDLKLDNIEELEETALVLESPTELDGASEDSEAISLNLNESELDPNLLSLDDNELSDLDNLIEEPLTTDGGLEDLDDLLAKEETPITANEKLSDLDQLLDNNLDSLDSLDSPTPEFATNEDLQPAAATLPKQLTVDATGAKGKVFDQTMRVSVRQLDSLNNLIGELVVKRNRLEEDQERLRKSLDHLLAHIQSLGDAGAKMHDMYERSLLEGALLASRQSSSSVRKLGSSGFVDTEQTSNNGSLDALELDRFTGFHLLSQDIIELIVRVREAASDIQFVVDESDKVTRTFREVTSQLQEGMNSSRMVAFGQTADRLPRAIRDISRKLHKQAELQVDGKDVLIDKMIVEHLYNPMTHLVNNAIAHGIESPEERTRKGKTPIGKITIRAFIQGNQTVISVSDDGAGIDPEIVKTKAVEKQLITWAQAQNLSQQEVYDLLFHAGFSTKDKADDFAGRGVGMDVVSTDLGKIRGTVSIESKVGQGTTFTIRLPLVLSICKALTCVYDNSQIAFPIDGVEDTRECVASDIHTNENGVKCISWQDKLLPFQPLSSLLSYNRQIRRSNLYSSSKEEDIISIVILNGVDNLLAIEVDKIKSEQEIVIKQIDGPIPKPPGISGATVLGDGTIVPIGDVLELIEIAQGKRTREIGFGMWSNDKMIQQPQAPQVRNEPLVLVVDDSITVRELLSLSFNKLGYRVEQARDGQEAWDKLRGGLPCDMIFCDIEMPRMNGLELLSNLQKDDNLKSIPVAMLTSRGADKHRQLASELGARAYLTKPYTEKDLMDVAQRLIQESQAAKKKLEQRAASNGDLSQDTETEREPLVLIIDDSVTVRELLSITFKKAGYRVEQARDGQEAWDKLRDGLQCDIAFCDIEMPRMNGLELLLELQQDERLSTLPIAMLTSRGAQKMRNLAAQRGARGYFVKPYVEDALIEAAAKMMKGEVLIDNLDN